MTSIKDVQIKSDVMKVSVITQRSGAVLREEGHFSMPWPHSNCWSRKEKSLCQGQWRARVHERSKGSKGRADNKRRSYSSIFLGVTGEFRPPSGLCDNCGAKHRKITGSNGRWQLLLTGTCEYPMNHSGAKEVMVSSDTAERSDPRSLPYFSCDCTVPFKI